MSDIIETEMRGDVLWANTDSLISALDGLLSNVMQAISTAPPEDQPELMAQWNGGALLRDMLLDQFQGDLDKAITERMENNL